MRASPPRRRVLRAAVVAGVWLTPFTGAIAHVYTFVDGDGVIHVTNVARAATARVVERPSPPAHTRPTSRGGLAASGSQRSRRYARIVEEAAHHHQVDAALIHAVIRAESNYNPSAVSAKGAVGLMQLMPATARRYGVADARDTTQNVLGGVRYLRDLLDMFHHNLVLALAAYNAGESAVIRHGGVPPYAETTNYVARVLDFYMRPNLVSDPVRTMASSDAE